MAMVLVVMVMVMAMVMAMVIAMGDCQNLYLCKLGFIIR